MMLRAQAGTGKAGRWDGHEEGTVSKTQENEIRSTKKLAI
jgi:hypothetical protein